MRTVHCALKENCLNSIKVATHSDISLEFKEKLCGIQITVQSGESLTLD